MKITTQTWAFKKKGSAEKFYRMLLNLARRKKATWHPELNKSGLKVRVSGEGYGSGKITPIDQTTFNKLDNLAAAHKGRRAEKLAEDSINEMELPDLDNLLKSIRGRVVRGSKATRERRLAGCLRNLPQRAARTGGIKVSGMSRTDLNPTPRRERNKEDQPRDATPGQIESIEENTMTLNDAIAQFRSIDEANIPAPAVSRTQPGGGSQFSSKSKFKYYGGADTGYDGSPATIRADPQAKGEEPYYPAVKGPVGADGREVVDVRVEDMEVDDLIGLLEQIAEASDSLEEYASLIEQHLGFDAVINSFKASVNVDNGELLLGRIYEAISNPVQEEGPKVIDPNDPMSDANRGVGIDDFNDHNETWDQDMAFAEGMMRGETTDAGLSGVQEANIPVGNPRASGPDGAQIAAKSKFRKYYSGPNVQYDGKAANKAADPESHAAMSHSAGAGGPGYTPDNREETDVRVESMRAQGQQFQPQANGQRPPEPASNSELDAFAASMSYPDTLIKNQPLGK